MKEFKISTLQTITDRNNISITMYMRDVNKYAMVTPDEEAQLASDIKKGGNKGERAKRRLIEANLRYVISVAKQYQQTNNSLELADLISEGNIGLMKAADTFDVTRGFKFISYATWWIRRSILEAIDNHCTTLRLPSNKVKALNKYHTLDNAMILKEQRHITLQEFCEATGLTVELASLILSASLSAVRMDVPIADNSDATYGDLMSSNSKTDSYLDHESLCIDINDVIGFALKDKEAEVVRRYYGLGCNNSMTIESIADSLNLSYERTRQMLKKALTKIRDSKYSGCLSKYLVA